MKHQSVAAPSHLEKSSPGFYKIWDRNNSFHVNTLKLWKHLINGSARLPAWSSPGLLSHFWLTHHFLCVPDISACLAAGAKWSLRSHLNNYSGQSNDITNNVSWRECAGRSDKAVTGSGKMRQEAHSGNTVMTSIMMLG